MSTKQSTENFITSATRQIFETLCTKAKGEVSSKLLVDLLLSKGLGSDDQRLSDFFQVLGELNALDSDRPLSLEQFARATHLCSTLIHRAVTGELRVPNFECLVEVVNDVYKKVLPNKEGHNATYIPQLAAVDPEQFGISVTTVDGQHFSVGDTDRQFCIQSCSKPLSYLIALNEFGEGYVHDCVGTEPSGRKFNEMTLKPVGKPASEGGHGGGSNRCIPHNPMINAGAIMSVSMVFPAYNRQKRLEKVLEFWKQLTNGAANTEDGKPPIGYDDDTYKSESATADRNWCLGYMMKECNAWPDCFTNLSDTLELYFQICSVLATNRAMSLMAATLANGGLNPISGERVVSPDHVRCALPLMLTSGMYDYSGQWAYDVGVPAKSGVGGCVFLVIPNVAGIAIWSPRLDDNGNSSRGVAVATELVKHLAIHNFEVFSGLSRKKIDLSLKKNQAKCAEIGDLLFAASQGDVQALRSSYHAGTDLYAYDYDLRSALHLAAAEGHTEAVELLVEHLPSSNRDACLNLQDRWGGTPLDDATHGGHVDCVTILKNAGGRENKKNERKLFDDESGSQTFVEVSPDAPPMLFAAAENDVYELISLSASGHNFLHGDYDRRTAFHLAASENCLDALKYLCIQVGNNIGDALNGKDRWGDTPLDNAKDGTECAKYLRSIKI